ncbi:hypothetical protein [Leucobacter luti]|uniref:Acetone carboxylase n=1 Tax=Leucobacter luti TaxID=340320 RepID=A0A4R6RZY8_9MICO|nr:hypothetical protein [Leucobacter luti]MCW2287756.1 hypothetical protein [Leucobacter luti]QYM76234.1 hypothetical protein K1X41_01805 [Leucobacter luti]TCK46081.1 hypothetical protein EDF60_1327 [Leucobacter luti]TDP92504.1 hypothetical protein EDF62_1718 [Leucobacter luti]
MSGIGVPTVTLGRAPEHQFSCSRAGCRDEALWAIRWRNPKIHTADRRKTWLACEPHLETLREFLAARDFPLEVESVATLADPEPTQSTNE